MNITSVAILTSTVLLGLSIASPVLAMNQRLAPTTTTVQIGPYPNKIACDFYQTKKGKIASCKNRAAAKKFCMIAMQSRLSQVAECQNDGRIVCTRPCTSLTKAKPFTACPYDPERRSGYTVTPYNFCAKR